MPELSQHEQVVEMLKQGGKQDTDDDMLVTMRRFGLIPNADDFEHGSVEHQLAIPIIASRDIVHDAESEAKRYSKGFKAELLEKQLAELGQGKLAELNRLRNHLDLQAEAVNQLSAEIALKPVSKPSTTAALDMDYIRRELRALPDDLSRTGVYFDAVEAGDEHVYRAFIEDPMRAYVPMLPDDILKQGEARWAETRAPALARRVQVLGEMLDNAKNAVSTAESVIRDLSGLKRDPVADALA